ELWVQSSCIQSAIWHPEAKPMRAGSLFEKAFIARRNDVCWGAYHDLKCLFDLALNQRGRENPQAPEGLVGIGFQPLLERHTPVLRLMFRGMAEAVDAYDREGPDSLRRVLAGLYKQLREDKVFSRCILTGHAHIDLVWIWPERMGELKAVNTFATANRLMQEYPEYKFAYSQPASYEAVARREPGLYAQVMKRIRESSWQATGAMYVESDTNLACGEALARSFLLGQQGFTAINGNRSRLTWLPDVFGYSACLPQIMAQTGVDYFFTTKLKWNAVNRFPYSSFVWRGNDGSEVLAHVTPEAGYNGEVSVEGVVGPMMTHQQADAHPEYLLPTGYGDGGGGPTDEMMERARRLGNLPGMPSIEWDHPESFFERMESVRSELPVHQGECYLEYHRGTYTTHGNLKAAFRGLERALQLAEAVSAATGQCWDLEYAWKRLVFAQFHDYIPGSSVWDVYLEGVPELEALAEDQRGRAADTLNGEDGEPSVFNPHAITVKKWIVSAAKKKPAYVELPPLSGSPIESVMTVEPTPVRLKGKTVSNGLASFRVNASGWIDRLEWEGVAVPMCGPLGQITLHPDRAARFDAWDIDRHVLALGEVCKAKPTLEPFTNGSHRAGVRVSRPVGEKSHATVSFILEAGSPLIHIEVELDWQEAEHLLKLNFPTEYAAAQARFGIPYGSVLRAQQPGPMVAEAMWEVPFSRYLAVFDEGEREGLFVVSESKYGASVRSGSVGVSLVRSPRVTGVDPEHISPWPQHLSRLEIPGPYSDIGRHAIRLAIGRYDSALPRERQPASLADTLYTAPVVYRGRPIEPVIEALEGGESLVPCWVKPVENGGWILRLHEVGGRRGQLKVRLADGWTLERTTVGQGAFSSCGDTVRFKPYEVVSLCVVRE
ncbi:MAG: alpha-mannosidase, partial [Puniceicoccales bacterium]